MPAPNRTSIIASHREIIARLRKLEPHTLDAIVALRDAQPGYPTATGGGGSAPTLDAAGNPPGLDRYLGIDDPAATDLRNLTTLTAQMLTASAQLLDIIIRWTAEPTTEGEPRRTVGGGDCVCCGRYCSGADTDRLRAGLCDPCRKSWSRSTLERGDWMLERRRELTRNDAD